jgi:hypothetical protein
MTGVTRSTANRLLRQAQADGVVCISRVQLQVLDASALRKRAGLRDASSSHG